MLFITVPLPPGVNIPTMGESTDDPHNHYDWIPADRNSKGDNDYDEINLQGARMLTAARARQGSNNGIIKYYHEVLDASFPIIVM